MPPCRRPIGLVLASVLAHSFAKSPWTHSPARQSWRRQLDAVPSANPPRPPDVGCDCDEFCRWSCDMRHTVRRNVTMYRVTPANITDLPNRCDADGKPSVEGRGSEWIPLNNSHPSPGSSHLLAQASWSTARRCSPSAVPRASCEMRPGGQWQETKQKQLGVVVVVGGCCCCSLLTERSILCSFLLQRLGQRCWRPFLPARR